MERVKIFYWRSPLSIPEAEGNFKTTELAWIHSDDFVTQEGEGWRVIGNSIAVVLPDEGQVVMATTMVQDFGKTIPDSM